MAESKKMEKNAFRPRPKNEKRRKLHFGHGRKLKNEKNCVSATAETEKTLRITFPTPWKRKNSLKTAFSPYEKRKNTLKTTFSPYGKRKNSLKMALTPYEKHKNSLKTSFSPYGKAERLMLKQTSRVYSFLNAASNAWFSVFVPIVMRRQFSQCSMCAQLCTAIP